VSHPPTFTIVHPDRTAPELILGTNAPVCPNPAGATAILIPTCQTWPDPDTGWDITAYTIKGDSVQVDPEWWETTIVPWVEAS
jgi:hypothetical protein